MTRISFAAGRDAQPAALERIAAHVVGRPLLGPRPVARPLFCGIGASYAALAVPVEILRGRGVPAYRVTAGEVADHPAAFADDLLIGVSQSGRSAETLAAFHSTSMPRLALVNVSLSPLAELAELTVDLGDEPDSYASTVGFTGTVLALDILAAELAGDSGAYAKWATIEALTTRARQAADDVLATIAGRAAGCVAADAVAAGASRAAAEETALLLREVPRVPAAASATRTYLHGEMESAGDTLHVIFGAGREVELAWTLANAGHLTLLVTTAAVEPGPNLGVVRLPMVEPAVLVVLETVVAQELAAVLAQERGIAAEAFVFANHDTKEGGVDPADFALGGARP
ncbi:SIS domain-containing protein [Hamadaea tsunoensis]|uniref:SIS domain-containing protein n=1 Tax=Hamadaea tsunoensis TaxID=53368 RepID=UPI00041E292A|nr:SIS domain-containing protein [Hamadaea tsunoensis]